MGWVPFFIVHTSENTGKLAVEPHLVVVKDTTATAIAGGTVVICPICGVKIAGVVV